MIIDVQKPPHFCSRILHQVVSVSFNYDVHFTSGLFELSNPLLAQVIAESRERNYQQNPKKIVAVIDAGLLEAHPNLLGQFTAYVDHYANVMQVAADPLVIPAGEASKNDPQLLYQIYQQIDAAGLCRHSYLLAIGGGATLDLSGYAAATAHRGIRLVRIPTTVLAQNDSGVGVKNGVNAFNKKNFLGTFVSPHAVLNDVTFLKTLSNRDWRSGLAEALKVALIKDADFFDWIKRNATALIARDLDIMQQVIYRCAQLHLSHIANGDPFEKGSARPLDFGHWAAHKLEQLTDYRLRHGEAVAIGIALDSTYSYRLGMLAQAEWQQILNTFITLGFTLFIPELAEQTQNFSHPRYLFRGLTEFQEHLGGELTLTLLQRIGKGIEVHEVDLVKYRQAIKQLSTVQ
jgi:3-dehydroquinate synthase